MAPRHAPADHLPPSRSVVRLLHDADVDGESWRRSVQEEPTDSSSAVTRRVHPDEPAVPQGQMTLARAPGSW